MTLKQAQEELHTAMQLLGSEPTLSDVQAEIDRFEALPAKIDLDLEGLYLLRDYVKSRRR